MKKLYEYMDKIGVKYSPERFGANYFKNAPELHFPGAFITLGAGENTTAGWRALEKYCKRWGYSLRPWGGYPGYTTYTVCRTQDRDALMVYSDYQRESVNACEKAIHLRHEGFYKEWSDKEFDEYLGGIMDFWGGEYLSAV